MPLKPTFVLTAIGLFLLSACSPRLLVKSYDQPTIKRIYSESIGDAAKPQPWEVSKNLVAIQEENPDLIWKSINEELYLLVSTWQKDTTYYKNDPKSGFYNTSNYPIWVTAAPELQSLCKDQKFGRKEGLDLRIKQLLGLPPTTEKNFFVEFWVRPQDLYRPCPDSEITDSECGLAFPEATPEAYVDWFNQLRLDSYYNPEWDKNYPWTELGYTFDWNPKNKTHIGLSEFIIGKNKNIIVKGFSTTSDYCSEQ